MNIQKIYQIANKSGDVLRLHASTAIGLYHATNDESYLKEFWHEFYLPYNN